MNDDSTASTPRFLNVSTMKDEAPFILEWVAWNRVIGFTDFLVYTNDCTDGTDLMLQRLGQLGLLTHEYNNVLRRGPHKSALKHAFKHPLYAEADWVFVSDVDEFLNVHHGGGKVTDLLAAYPDADVIPVVWRVFSANKETEVIDDLITERLTDSGPVPGSRGETPSGFVKTLFRNTPNVERLGLHRPFFKEGSNEVWSLSPPSDEDALRLVGELGLETAQLNHYAVRSAKSFLIKRARGRANHTHQKLGFDYWKKWNVGGLPDRSMLRHRDALKAEFDRLVSDPILMALHCAALEIHNQRAEALLKDSDSKQIYNQIVADWPAATAPTAKQVSAKQAPEAAQGSTDTIEQSISPEEGQSIIDAILLNSDKARRAPKRRELRQTMLDEVMPKGGRCAEIGVWEGDFSAEILNITKPKELVLIDPWDLLAVREEEHTHSQHNDAVRMREKFDQVAGGLGQLPNCVLRKGFSAEVLESYPDHYFDWVYIDGNHLYDFVLEDIMIAARKVRPGGIIAGDDLFWKKDERMHVREAVREAMRRLGNQASQTRRGAQFIITLKDTK
ncbi:glycosyltransferase family 2 protein [Parasedimentitalea huanghaiensis]|uniref:Methyltransferase domain-containing protein n=1 Tax=Parasedimentitalea huanghaiensis TaxID=2682100 RepID=A0A6L6WI00_9RHOB|nr:glycosyltransferase family 2 protein [Zongyanglinia huanghaiensis]MVO17334.1 hypothetical protein [Zongyanglinia huanghaiensis]